LRGLLPALNDRLVAKQKIGGINRWELVTCALGGHITYAPDEEALADRLSGKTGLGEVWRCLRCGEFTLGAARLYARRSSFVPWLSSACSGRW
jgi:hypothetical protein